MGKTSEQPLLSCRNVTKKFGSLVAVGDLSFDLAAGEVLGIGGPNGAGKTTLFEMISGQTTVTSGQILLDGRDVTRDSAVRRCHAGMARVFQLNTGFDSLSVRDNIRVAAYYGRRNRIMPGLGFSAEVETAVDDALERVGLVGRGRQSAATLTVIDRKLLMIAGALAMQPKLLLLDEPVGGLTHREIDQVAKVVAEVAASGVTVVLIEHVMRFLVQLSTRVMILHHGRKLYEGSATGLAHDPGVVEVYLGKEAGRDVAAMAAGKAEGMVRHAF
ncbi:ABC transporter ATP-binding protein [Mesorhizobium sp. L-8-3]|uniref:ABC transporter ATP-binding protein n=1 Tax=Mesorhizobium sp. L-8-3 TaxID=2744522 RepID=UPI0019291A64|nr:ATP-binding cassette domain-containing protein [Mesorhizobium sp. L-8-3]BCH27932.1 ABC transporter ATP-binding protein [Mesorhizobium sp. L-8-3]